MSRKLLAVALFLILAPSVIAAGQPVLRVAYAGSMGAVMDRGLGPAFAKVHGVTYQGIGQGAYGLARLLAGKQLQADVFVAITPGPVKIVQDAGLLGATQPVASTQMVIAYSPNSRFAAAFRAAAAGKIPWYSVLERKGLRFGRTDPATDPQGRNIVLTMLLAERYYKQPRLAHKILGSVRNPRQIFTEPSLLSRLEAGQVDASSGYLSAVVSHRLPYLRLPDEINLGNPAMAADWYDKVGFTLTKPDGATERAKVRPLVFYAGVLNTAANPKAAREFVNFLDSPAGQKIFAGFGYSPPPKGGADARGMRD
ncbi:MAG: extracellular solute-binding protein [Gammaproteobacteria bacterium]|nr:extracellular solute-binding protein [Gammaproteobacteria bacterium]